MKLILSTLATLLILAGSALSVELTSVEKGQQIIQDQISAFLEGDAERAFSHAAPQIRAQFKSSDKFITMVKRGYQPLFLPHDFKFTKNKLIENTQYQELIVTGENGKRWRAGYSLKLQADGSWKIIGVILAKLNGDSI